MHEIWSRGFTIGWKIFWNRLFFLNHFNWNLAGFDKWSVANLLFSYHQFKRTCSCLQLHALCKLHYCQFHYWDFSKKSIDLPCVNFCYCDFFQKKVTLSRQGPSVLLYWLRILADSQGFKLFLCLAWNQKIWAIASLQSPQHFFQNHRRVTWERFQLHFGFHVVWRAEIYI